MIGIFIGHYVGDFLLQTRWMARGKSKHLFPLAVHTLVYTLTITAAGIVSIAWGKEYVTWEQFVMVLWWGANNSIPHFCTDYFTSRSSAFLYRRASSEYEIFDAWYEWGFWGVIGLDQLIHLLVLYYTWNWMVV